MNRDFYYLDSLTKKYTKGENFFSHFGKSETNLPILYKGV